MKNLSKGFTLIELLIVIAVLGILAAVVLVAIDPIEQLARGRDAGRKGSVGQLGRALQAYFTVQAGFFAPAAWTNTATNPLIATGEIRAFPTNPAFPGGVIPGCTTGNVANLFCYKADLVARQAITYTHMESKVETTKAGCGGALANTYYLFSTLNGRSGTICESTETALTPTRDYGPNFQ